MSSLRPRRSNTLWSGRLERFVYDSHMIATMDVCNYIRDLDALWRKATNVFLEIEHLRSCDHPSEENDVLQEHLERHVEQLYIRTRLAFEVISATETRTELDEGFRKHKEDAAEIGYDDNNNLRPWSLEFLGRYVSMLDSLFPPESTVENQSQIELLERILTSTPKILADRNLEPAKEPEVYKAVGSVLSLVFPDYTPSVNLAKPLKAYRPDFGFPGMGIAVEYKFATTEQEVKTALDGIFSDMQGYGGSREWTIFYAVIYMTEHFYTQEQIKAHMQVADGRQNWRILPVYGVGKRKAKKTRKTASSSLGST